MSGSWECGKPVDGSVCMGPHPGFRMRRALAHGHVEGLGRRLRVTPRKYCGRVMASCGLTKHMTVHARWAVDSRAMEGRSD